MAVAPQYNGNRLEKRVNDYGGYLKVENEVKQKKFSYLAFLGEIM